MADKDKKYYSNPSHAKNFGQYSPPVPEDLLEKLAAMKMQSNTNQQPQKPHQYDQHHSNPLYSNTIPMAGVITHQDALIKETHRVISNYAPPDRHNDAETPAKEQIKQTKRQKREDTTRAGQAMQANPRL
jgi:hypothetical protein